MTVDGRRSHDPRPMSQGLTESEQLASNGDIYIRLTTADDVYEPATVTTNPPFRETDEAVPQLPLVAPDRDERPSLAWPGRWLLVAGAIRSGRTVRSNPPGLALRLFAGEDAAHYEREWRAHLTELIADGEHRQARRDRRRMAWGAPWLALQLRWRALLRRRLRGWR